MFLSNPRPYFLLTGFLALIFQACGSSVANENKPISLTDDTKGEFPFSTKEPEVYQGDFFVISEKYEEHFFIARKGEKWRFDFPHGDLSTIRAEPGFVISLNRREKTLLSTPEHAIATTDPNFFIDLTSNLFNGKVYREFEEIGREGSQVKYRVMEKTSKDSVLITVDTQTGMIVRQEFTGSSEETGKPVSYVYEIRNLKTNVDDSVFAIPDGYRKVLRNENPSPVKKNK